MSVDGRIDPQKIEQRAIELGRKTGEGDAIGRLLIGEIDLNIVLIEGTEEASLQAGPGHYPETVLPGQRGTVAIAGHRTTYLAPFRHLDRLSSGDSIVLEMPYATFTYDFESQKIVEPTDIGVVRDVGHDRIVLTACNPIYSAAQRIVVTARLVDVDPLGGDERSSARRSGGGLPSDIAAPGLGATYAFAAGLVIIAAGAWFSSRGRARPV